jgi:Ca2+-binding EF-hand superfamily protein
VLKKDLQLPLEETELSHSLEQGRDALVQFVIEQHVQVFKAKRVFELLDQAGKGCVILEDLQREATEMLAEDTQDDELIAMLNEFDQSGDGILSLDDFIKIAKVCNL